jgi:hypothetical protein
MSATIDRRVSHDRKGCCLARSRRISTMANRPVTLPPSTLDPAAGWMFTGRAMPARRQASPHSLMADDDDLVDDDDLDDDDLDDDDLEDDEDDEDAEDDDLGDAEIGDDDDSDEEFDDDLDEDEEEDEDDLTAQKHTPTRVH